MNILQTNRFAKTIKKLHPNQKAALDDAVHFIISAPAIGQQKKGRLRHIRVHKFLMQGQLTLLAYVFDPKIPELTLYSLGSHENFYKNLENK